MVTRPEAHKAPPTFSPDLPDSVVCLGLLDPLASLVTREHVVSLASLDLQETLDLVVLLDLLAPLGQREMREFPERLAHKAPLDQTESLAVLESQECQEPRVTGASPVALDLMELVEGRERRANLAPPDPPEVLDPKAPADPPERGDVTEHQVFLV